MRRILDRHGTCVFRNLRMKLTQSIKEQPCLKRFHATSEWNLWSPRTHKTPSHQNRDELESCSLTPKKLFLSFSHPSGKSHSPKMTCFLKVKVKKKMESTTKEWLSWTYTSTLKLRSQMEHPTSCMLFLLGGISIAMMNQTQDRLTVATLLQVRDILRVRGTCKTDLAS